MITQKMESLLLPSVQQFVSDLRGRYIKMVGDDFLVALLMHRLSEPANHRSASRAELILNGDPNAAYEAACPVFETILEHRLHVTGNGHHAAQDFSRVLGQLKPQDTP